MNTKKRTNKISEHFSYKDFACKCKSCEGSSKISLGLIGGLELLRSKAKNRINIVKGFICSESKESQNTVKKNYHTLGQAADIIIENTDLTQAFKLAQEIPEFFGIGIDFSKNYIHVDTRKEKKRNLWIKKQGKSIEVTPENQDQHL